MLQSVFILLLVVAFVLIGFAFWKREPNFLALGSIILFACGLLLLDTSPTGGLEIVDGMTFVLNDSNSVIAADNNMRYLNAGNDASLNVLGNLFVWGSVAGLMLSLGFMLSGRVDGLMRLVKK